MQTNLDTMEWKFFPRDVMRGKADKVGDHFYAMVMGAQRRFRVTTHGGTWFMAVLA